jgi:serine/threonine protein kinase
VAADGKYQPQMGQTSCLTATTCSSGQITVRNTATANAACLAPGVSRTINSVGHFYYKDPITGVVDMVDYIAASQVVLGGALLPASLAFDPTSGGTLFATELVAPETLKLRVLTVEDVDAVINIDIRYCESGAQADWDSAALRTVVADLNIYAFDGFSDSTTLSLDAESPTLTFTANGTCFRLTAETQPLTVDVALDSLLMELRSSAALAAAGLASGSRIYDIESISAILVDYTAKVPGALAADPGNYASVVDTTPPALTGCSADIAAEVDSGAIEVLVAWPSPVAFDNSGLQPSVVVSILSQISGEAPPSNLTTLAGQSSFARLSLPEAPYVVTYTARDGSNNEATCIFDVGVSFDAVAFTFLHVLEFGDLAGEYMASLYSSLYLQILLDGQDSRSAPGVPLSFTADLAGHTQAVFRVKADDSETFTLSLSADGIVSLDVDLTWIRSDLNIDTAFTNDPNVYAMVRLVDDRGEDDVVVEESRLDVTLAAVTDAGIVLQGFTPPLLKSHNFTFVDILVNYPRGLASGSGVATYHLLNQSQVAMTEFYHERGSEATASARLGFFAFSDFEPPTIFCPNGTISGVAESGKATSIVTWPAITATDTRVASPIITVNNPLFASGAAFEITYPGNPHRVVFTASDGPNQRSCTFFVAVADNEPPQAVCPASNATLQLASRASSVVPSASLAQPTDVSDNSQDDVIVTNPLAAGTPYPVGTHLLEATIADRAGNTISCDLRLTVEDLHPPVVNNCPNNQTIDTTDRNPTVSWGLPNITDNDQWPGHELSVVSSAEPGDSFPRGVTRVVYTAVDYSGNTAQCDFYVTVLSSVSVAEAEAAIGGSTIGGIGGGVAVLFLLICVVFVVSLRRARRKIPANFQAILEELNLGAYVEDDGELRKPTEVGRSTVHIVGEIGKGNFGIVAKAQYAEKRGNTTMPAYLVAVKKLHETASSEARHEILSEAAVMAQFDHDNVLRLVGVVTAGDPILVVMEFMEHGSLQAYLKADGANVSYRMRLEFARGLADGLAYLHARKFIHRDVAARNVLLNSILVPKLADFGLTREHTELSEYYKSGGGALPVRWTAPEALENSKFSAKTDAFSYGIVVYEIFTNADTPYKGWNNQRVWVSVTGGYRLPCPEGCEERIHQQIMLPCWAANPDERLAMTEVSRYITKLLDGDDDDGLKVEVDAAATNEVGAATIGNSGSARAYLSPAEGGDSDEGGNYYVGEKSLSGAAAIAAAEAAASDTMLTPTAYMEPSVMSSVYALPEEEPNTRERTSATTVLPGIYEDVEDGAPLPGEYALPMPQQTGASAAGGSILVGEYLETDDLEAARANMYEDPDGNSDLPMRVRTTVPFNGEGSPQGFARNLTETSFDGFGMGEENARAYISPPESDAGEIKLKGAAAMAAAEAAASDTMSIPNACMEPSVLSGVYALPEEEPASTVLPGMYADSADDTTLPSEYVLPMSQQKGTTTAGGKTLTGEYLEIDNLEAARRNVYEDPDGDSNLPMRGRAMTLFNDGPQDLTSSLSEATFDGFAAVEGE